MNSARAAASNARAAEASPARSSLRVETLKPRLAKFSPTIQHQAEELYAALDVDAARQRTGCDAAAALGLGPAHADGVAHPVGQGAHAAHRTARDGAAEPS